MTSNPEQAKTCAVLAPSSMRSCTPLCFIVHHALFLHHRVLSSFNASRFLLAYFIGNIHVSSPKWTYFVSNSMISLQSFALKAVVRASFFVHQKIKLKISFRVQINPISFKKFKFPLPVLLHFPPTGIYSITILPKLSVTVTYYHDRLFQMVATFII